MENEMVIADNTLVIFDLGNMYGTEELQQRIKEYVPNKLLFGDVRIDIKNHIPLKVTSDLYFKIQAKIDSYLFDGNVYC